MRLDSLDREIKMTDQKSLRKQKSELQSGIIDRLTQESMQKIYRLSFPFEIKKDLELTFDVYNFKGNLSTTKVELNYALSTRDITFLEKQNELYYSFEERISVFDKNNTVVVNNISKKNYSIDVFDHRQKGLYILDKIDLELPPDEYVCILIIKDLNSKREGFYAAHFRVADFEKQDLAISNIEYASEFGSSSESDFFRKGPIEVIPYPSKAISTQKELNTYFEIYSLHKNFRDETDFTIEYFLVPDDISKGIVYSQYPYMGTTTDENITLSFDMSKKPNKKYYLLLRVTDNISKQQTTTISTFRRKKK